MQMCRTLISREKSWKMPGELNCDAGQMLVQKTHRDQMKAIAQLKAVNKRYSIDGYASSVICFPAYPDIAGY